MPASLLCPADNPLTPLPQACSLGESLTYGWPHLLLPSYTDFDSEEEAVANRRAVAALCAVRREGGERETARGADIGNHAHWLAFVYITCFGLRVTGLVFSALVPSGAPR